MSKNGESSGSPRALLIGYNGANNTGAEARLLAIIDDVRATLEWVDWFNNRRLFEPIGNVPPAEYEEVYNRSQETLDMVAGLT